MKAKPVGTLVQAAIGKRNAMNRADPQQQFQPGMAITWIACWAVQALVLAFVQVLSCSPEPVSGNGVPLCSLSFHLSFPWFLDVHSALRQQRCMCILRQQMEGFTKSLRATYFPASVHFVPETRLALKETSAPCQGREMSCSHSSVAPMKWMLRQPRLQYAFRWAFSHPVEWDDIFLATAGAQVDSAALTKGFARI